MPDLTLDDFTGRMKTANDNVNSILGYEPSIGKVILYLSMAAASDCADAMDPEEAVESDICVIETVVPLACQTARSWSSDEIIEFGKEPELNNNEWLDMFLDAQGFLDDVIEEHLKMFGESDEERQNAFNEVSNTLVYMISAACARCSNALAPMKFAEAMIRKTYAYIKDECKLVPRDEIEKP